MGHTRLKKKKKGWATQKARAQRGGFNPDSPTKDEQQAIDSFHDFWPLMRGIFQKYLKKKVNDTTVTVAVREETRLWHLMRSIIRWLLINYSVPSLHVTLSRPLLRTVPTYDFDFKTYTTNKKAGDLFFTSLLSPSGIEPKGRDYVKIPQAEIWQQPDEQPDEPATPQAIAANFRSLFDVLFPGTAQNIRNQSTMYIVCDSGAGEIRKFGDRSVTAAATVEGHNLDIITETSAIAGAIAALAQAFALVGPADKPAFQTNIVGILSQNVVESLRLVGRRQNQARINSDWCNIIGSIYIAPIIIIAAGQAAAMANIPAIATATQTRINETTPLQAPTDADELALYQLIIQQANALNTNPRFPLPTDPTFPALFASLLASYTAPNKLEIILSSTQQIAAIIVSSVTTAMASQIIEVANAATLISINAVTTAAQAIGPFIKEIATAQTFADSATANPQPSTIPGDIYPILYKFVTQERQPARPPGAAQPHAFPEPATPVTIADRFYSDANIYTYGRYELRYERHQWNPATGLGFKFVIGDIRAPLPADAAAAAARRYEIDYGMVGHHADANYNALGPNAGLLAACCLQRVLAPNPVPMPAALPDPITYDIINRSINDLLQGLNRNAILARINPPLNGMGESFADRADTVHPYIHFKGNDPIATSPFYQLPPELWLDMKRAGDRDQVMAAYRLSLLTNPDGNPIYPYLVFVTGDELCAAIAVKKGLATIYQSDEIIRYWPKGIVYGPPDGRLPGWPVQFTRPRPNDINFQMYTAAAPSHQYSIQSWGGNQMKGGDYYTMAMHDKIEDGYGNQYSFDHLKHIDNDHRVQVDYPENLQELKKISDDPTELFNTPETYVMIDSTSDNLKKLLMMNFGREVNMSMILYACNGLGTGRIVCTPVQLIVLLGTRGINPQAVAPQASLITPFLDNIDTAKAAAQAASSQFIIIQAAAAQATEAQAAEAQAAVQTAIAQVQTTQTAVNTAIDTAIGNILNGIIEFRNFSRSITAERLVAAKAMYDNNQVQQWVYDMIAIFSFTAVPNETEDDPSIKIRPLDASLDNMELYDIEYMIKQFAYCYKQPTFQQFIMQPQITEVHRAGFIRKYGIVPIYMHINKKFRGGRLPEEENNPIFVYISEKITEYTNMRYPASILSSFYTFCHMMIYNTTVSAEMTNDDAISSSASSSAASSSAASSSAASSSAQPSAAASILTQFRSSDAQPYAITSFGPSSHAQPASYVQPASAATSYSGQAGPAQAMSQPAPSNANAPVMTNAANVASVSSYGPVGPVSAAEAASPARQVRKLKKGINGNEARRKRENLTMRLRREKREAAVTAKRTTASTGTGNLVDGGGRRRTQKNHKRKRHGTQRKRSHKGSIPH